MIMLRACDLTDEMVADHIAKQPFRVGDRVIKENGDKGIITNIRRVNLRDIWPDGTYLTAELNRDDGMQDAVRLSSLVFEGGAPSRGLAHLVARYRS